MVSWAKKQSKTLNTVMVLASFLVSLEIISTNLVGAGWGGRVILNALKLIVHRFPCFPPQEVKGSQVQDDVPHRPAVSEEGHFIYMHLDI